MSGTAFSSACISMTSTIEVSSTTSRSQSSGLSSLRLKPPPLGSTSSRRWMVLASKPVASVMRLAARPVGAHSSKLHALRRENAQDGVDDGRLADARSAGDDQHLGDQSQPDGGYLAFGERQAGASARSRAVPCRDRSRAKAACPLARRSSRSAMACSAR